MKHYSLLFLCLFLGYSCQNNSLNDYIAYPVTYESSEIDEIELKAFTNQGEILDQEIVLSLYQQYGEDFFNDLSFNEIQEPFLATYLTEDTVSLVGSGMEDSEIRNASEIDEVLYWESIDTSTVGFRLSDRHAFFTYSPIYSEEYDLPPGQAISGSFTIFRHCYFVEKENNNFLNFPMLDYYHIKNGFGSTSHFGQTGMNNRLMDLPGYYLNNNDTLLVQSYNVKLQKVNN